MKRLTREDVIELLQRKQGDKTQVEFAAEIGISPSYLSEIYRGTREPAAKVLDWLKLERLTEFQGKSA